MIPKFHPYQSQKKPFVYFRFCRKCEKKFKPSGKGSELCDVCYLKSKQKNKPWSKVVVKSTLQTKSNRLGLPKRNLSPSKKYVGWTLCNLLHDKDGASMAMLKVPCTKCGVMCSGKLQLLTDKLIQEPVCQSCFIKTEMNNHLKEAKNRIKK